MGVPVNGDDDGKLCTVNDNPDEIGASDPVVYQLVRVNGDGTLIPATDDELVDFEHLMEDESKLSYTDCGTRQCDNTEVDSKEVFYKDQADVDGPPFMQPNLFDAHTKMQSAEGCSETGKNGAKETVYKTFSSPDFSLLHGEICLEKFSVRELQEAFRATFGRYTSIKDKLWLKRRIAMGLTNSCDIPSTDFIIKDNKIVLSIVKEDTTSRTLNNLPDSGLIINLNNTTALLIEPLEESLVDAADRVEKLQAFYSHGAEKSLVRCDEGSVNPQIEQCGIKRIRKPTRRYIEELSEVDTTEFSGRLVCPDKTSVQDQTFKSRVKRTCMVDRNQDLLEGFDARIPCVHRGRRGRPRKDFLTLMNFVHVEGGKQIPDVLSKEQFYEHHANYYYCQDAAINENPDTIRTLMANVRKKHHRAWTLGEVLKLVEGVSRYGAGKWSEIRRVSFTSGTHRTSVDLKDKWRNLLKASFAQVPTDNGTACSRKPTSLPIPTAILQRVRELAEKHSQSYSKSATELGSGQFNDHPEAVQETDTGLL